MERGRGTNLENECRENLSGHAKYGISATLRLRAFALNWFWLRFSPGIRRIPWSNPFVMGFQLNSPGGWTKKGTGLQGVRNAGLRACLLLPRDFVPAFSGFFIGRLEMSRGESKRWNGWLLGVCALLALMAVYSLNSGNRGKSSVDPDNSPNTPLADFPSTPEPSSPTPNPAPRTVPSPDNTLASVSGTVRFADSNEPVSGTLVQLACTTFSLTTHTDQCGSYTLTGLPPKTGLWITAEDRQADLYMYDTSDSLELKVGENRTDLDLVLYRGRKGLISGKVVGTRICFDPALDNQTSLSFQERYRKEEKIPLSGIRIHLQAKLNHYPGRVYHDDSTTTDEEGNYRFENLPPGWFWIEVVSLPKTMYTRSNNALTNKVDLELDPITDANFEIGLDGISISGRITDEEGLPLSGIEVIEDPNHWSNDDANMVRIETETDANGYYRLDHLPQADFISAAQYLSSGDYSGESYEIFVNDVFKVVPAITENSLKEGMDFLEFMTEKADRLNGVPQLAAISKNRLPKSKGYIITGVDFVLQKRSFFSGYIVDPQGKPIQADDFSLQEVELNSANGTQQTSFGLQSFVNTYRSAKIASTGYFEFSSLRAGQYSIKVCGGNPLQSLHTEPTTITLGIGERVENFRVGIDISNRENSLEFTALNAKTRQPVEGFRCFLKHEIGELYHPVGGLAIETFRTGDVVRFENLPTGRASLSFLPLFLPYNSGSYLNATIDIEIKPGKNVLDPVLLTPMGQLLGHVQETGSGKPIEKYKFSVIREQSNPYGNVVFLRRDESRPGTFLMGRLIPGMNTLRFSADGYGSQTVNVDIKAGEITEQTIDMKPAGRLVGRVTCDGRPADSYRVCARVPGKNNDPSTSFSGGIFIEGTKTSNGAYECANLGEDEHDILVEYSYPDTTGIQYKVFQYDSVRVKPGEELRKDFRFDENAEITGLIECSIWARKVFLEVQNNQPDPFSFKPGQNRRVATLETEHAQTPYRIRYLSPGTYTVLVSYEDNQEKKHEMPPKTVTLQPGQIETVNITN